MRWQTKPVPKLGDRIRVTRFAWCPIECDDGVLVWLERYIEERELARQPERHARNGWIPAGLRWVTVGRFSVSTADGAEK